VIIPISFENSNGRFRPFIWWTIFGYIHHYRIRCQGHKKSPTSSLSFHLIAGRFICHLLPLPFRHDIAILSIIFFYMRYIPSSSVMLFNVYSEGVSSILNSHRTHFLINEKGKWQYWSIYHSLSFLVRTQCSCTDFVSSTSGIRQYTSWFFSFEAGVFKHSETAAARS